MTVCQALSTKSFTLSWIMPSCKWENKDPNMCPASHSFQRIGVLNQGMSHPRGWALSHHQDTQTCTLWSPKFWLAFKALHELHCFMTTRPRQVLSLISSTICCHHTDFGIALYHLLTYDSEEEWKELPLNPQTWVPHSLRALSSYVTVHPSLVHLIVIKHLMGDGLWSISGEFITVQLRFP